MKRRIVAATVLVVVGMCLAAAVIASAGMAG